MKKCAKIKLFEFSARPADAIVAHAQKHTKIINLSSAFCVRVRRTMSGVFVVCAV